MRILITGGAGFLGSHLSDLLLQAGHSVICIDNLVTGRMDNIAHWGSRDAIHRQEAGIGIEAQREKEHDECTG